MVFKILLPSIFLILSASLSLKLEGIGSSAISIIFNLQYFDNLLVYSKRASFKYFSLT